ncbi:MAG: P-type conjugative transfer protein TrbJ [Hyphomonadaceae bacterium]|nr:P-type conjugative transfer protein TrbJ [Hyphomonadaceae bacterium]
MRGSLSKLLAGAALAALLAVGPAQAQLPVIDPANLAQSVIQAAHALEQIHNQVQQIEQQARMLARNPLQLSPELTASIQRARSLFDTAQGIAFDVRRVGEDIRTLYPDTWENFNLRDIVSRSDQWIAEDRRALERAMRAEANAAEAVETSRGRIDSALSASSGAEGQTGAVQAGNQLLGIQATQLAEIQALLAAQSRALTTERLQRAAQEARGREIQRRAFPTESTGDLPPARTAF